MKAAAKKRKAAPAGSSLTKSAREWMYTQRPALLFAGRFVLWVTALTALSLTAPFQHLLHGYLGGIARLASGLLNRLGIDSHANDVTVSSARYALTVAESCSGLELMLFLFSTILAFPIAWRWKWPGIAVGALLISLTNLIRVASLFAVGVYRPAAVEMVHLEIWPLGLVVITLVCWLVWMQWATRAGASCLHAS